MYSLINRFDDTAPSQFSAMALSIITCSKALTIYKIIKPNIGQFNNEKANIPLRQAVDIYPPPKRRMSEVESLAKMV